MRSEAKKKRILFISAVLGGMVLFFMQRSLGARVLDLVSSCIITPTLYMRDRCVQPVIRWLSANRDIAQLQAQIDQLLDDNNELYERLIATQATHAYADDIQEVLSFKQRYADNNPKVVRIISRHLTPKSQSITINAGSQNGMQKDMLLVHHNALIGRVSDVYPWYSRVQLVTDPDCKIAAYCAQTKAKGIYTGNGNDNASLQHVSHLDSVHEGDIIISSGEGMIYPQGFALGVIKRVQTNDLHHTITLHSLYHMKAIDYCIVIDRAATA